LLRITSASQKVSYLEHARSRNIDGVLIASVDFQDPAVIELANSGLPVVTIDYVYNGCTAIMSDNEVGVASEVAYAYKLGHRRIAFIHGELTDVTKKRLAGFQRQCAKLGLEFPKNISRPLGTTIRIPWAKRSANSKALARSSDLRDLPG
jgi:DNA-binding LacI/PurR family transcriptional regulator